jgi:glutaredoxin 3
LNSVSSVVIYTTKVCPYCVRAKALFARKGIAYREIDVTHDDGARNWLIQATGQRTVPQIFINDQALGGFDDVAALDRVGELDRLLSSPASSAPAQG